MRIQELHAKLLAKFSPDLDLSQSISSISCDSRKIQPGSLFFAVKGSEVDSHKFIPDVLEKGAVCVVSEDEEECKKHTSSYIVVTDIRDAIADIAALFHGNPTLELPAVGITGTNGKTSVAWIVTSTLRHLEKAACYVGTLGFNSVDENCSLSTNNTTPEPLSLYSFLQEEQNRGAEVFVLEATSQGLVQKRSRNIAWDIAAFTNFSRDHLDLHGTLEAYADAKKQLFSSELAGSPKKNKIAVINIDDELGREFYKEFKTEFTCLTYSERDNQADVYLESAKLFAGGSELVVRIDGESSLFQTKLVGRYNVSNTLAALAIVRAVGTTGQSPRDLAEALNQVPSVPGRLELVPDPNISVFVDYAHTPDALDSVQASLRELNPKRLITVFGCGGDRDRGKRPLMGKSVASRADYAIITSDNPRSEDPEKIIEDIVPGFEGSDIEFEAIPDRQKAIYHAIKIADEGDFVLVAGKGHEDYQEINGEKLEFLDLEVCQAALRKRNKV